MTNSKKLIGLILLACFMLTALIGVGVFGVGTYRATAAEAANVEHYYGNQLNTAEQKAFYKAMETMYLNEIFIKGEDYDMTAAGLVSQAQLEAYANGDTTLLDAMGAARDAFYTDYADVIYVNFEYLSLRVTQSGNAYKAYLGAGRSDNYWLEDFTADNVQARVNAYQVKRDAIVNKAKAATPTAEQVENLGQELANQVAKIRVAHAEIAKGTVYRLENNAQHGAGHVRTPYGAFVNGEALCEGYSRAFKVVMDKLGVPCVLINGGYRHTENQIEEHMWTYVQLVDGNWYAVDMTFDDINLDAKVNGKVVGRSPIEQFDPELKTRATSETEEYGYYYSEEYFLKGQFTMNVHHELSPYKSAVQYAFEYPTLSMHAVGTEEMVSDYIKVIQTPSIEAQNSTDIYISVLIDGEWCSHVEAAAKGYYLLIRHEGNYLPEKIAGGKLNGGDLVTDDIEGSFKAEYSTGYKWAYLYNPTMPEPLYGNFEEENGYSVIRNESKATGIEIAVTTTPPRDYANIADIDKIEQMTTFMGDSSVFYARSGFIPIKFGDPDYQPAPHIVRADPIMTTKLIVRGTVSLEVTIEYDQLLELPKDDNGKEIAFTYSVYGMRAGGEILKGTNAVPISVMSNVTWYSGKLENDVFTNSWIKFTFKPSQMFAHDNILYMFDFNLVGQNSGKQVNTASYAAAFSTGYCSLGVPGYNWRIFGQPNLIEADDLSREGWEDSNGNKITNTKDRLALVVTTPTQQQENEMNGLIEDRLGYGQDDVSKGGFESFTYNIQLTICKACVIKTGEKVRLSIGFPEGFTYESSMNGVTFKMYHFIHDEQDNITGVEEIPITITPLGFIILVDSFSPFALVAVPSEKVEEPIDISKTVVISANTGGSAVASEVKDNETAQLFRVEQGGSRVVSIYAHEGYEIESITLNGETIEPNTKMSHSESFAYEHLAAKIGAINFVEVKFVSKKILENQEKNNEASVVVKQQTLKQPVITVADDNKNVVMDAGGELRLEPTVEVSGTTTYRWYKDDVLLADQTSSVLVIRNAQPADSGSYVLKLTSASMFATYSAESVAMSVTINPVVEPAPTTPSDPVDNTFPTAMVVGIAVAVGLIALCIVLAVIVSKKKKKAE